MRSINFPLWRLWKWVLESHARTLIPPETIRRASNILWSKHRLIRGVFRENLCDQPSRSKVLQWTWTWNCSDKSARVLILGAAYSFAISWFWMSDSGSNKTALQVIANFSLSSKRIKCGSSNMLFVCCRRVLHWRMKLQLRIMRRNTPKLLLFTAKPFSTYCMQLNVSGINGRLISHRWSSW